MVDVKRHRRPYRSRKRAEQARETRQAVLDAALKMFVSVGWAKATVARIAAAAGVSSETLYVTFGSKTALLQELVMRAVRGGLPGVPLLQQETPRRIAEEPDQTRQIELFAGDIAGVLQRVAALMDVVRVAALSEPEMAAMHANLQRQRRKNLEWFAVALQNQRPLGRGLDTEQATSILWRIASPELYLLMRDTEEVSQDAYVAWLAETLVLLLLR